ncbi:hypothetical protein TIFTF001_001880 [Ficus carica]|uniref:Uncharacterized protein n=1 Tax=Ficus carica TaxID=3494 RepID=A0AA87ZK62_FICCA|nr:hypothetical protein TIFTF001_001880 [Ficus carica]
MMTAMVAACCSSTRECQDHRNFWQTEVRRLRKLFSLVTRAASSLRSGFSFSIMSGTMISPWCRDSGVASLCSRLWSAIVMVERREERNGQREERE